MALIYNVFARKQHPEPLVYIGSVEVERAEEVTAASLRQFGPEDEWLEMVAVPHEKIILVFSDKKESEG